MFRMWGKMFKDSHMLKDIVIEDDSGLNRTKKVYNSLAKICENFDLATPIWLDSNINDFKRVSKTRFRADSFVESIEFDYLEIQIIEEDDFY